MTTITTVTISHEGRTSPVKGCSCGWCRRARKAYDLRRARAIEEGTWNPWMEAEKVRAHVERIQRDTHLSLRAIAVLLDQPHPKLTYLMRGAPWRGTPPPTRIQHDVGRRILEFWPTLDMLATRTPVAAAGTRRRLQALAVSGWSLRAVAARSSGRLKIDTLYRLPRQRYVFAETARTVRDMYDLLWDQEPPTSTRYQRVSATMIRNMAAKRRLPPSLAWDDDEIDLPYAEADLGKEVTRQEAIAEDMEWLTRQGFTFEQAAERLDVSCDYAQKACKRQMVKLKESA